MLILSLALSAAVVAQSTDLRTVAETSGYTRTARHAEVVGLLDALAASSPNARRASMGTTVEGRDIPMLIVSDPPVSNGREARELSLSTGRPVVLAIGNIHAGEVDGKEALPMLARDMLVGDQKDLLSRVIVVFAPVYNADGNERVKAGQRHGQNGPEETGVRENAHGRDLNRDFVKAEEPETAALLRAFNEFDPHVFIDCHITNGSYHRYIITYGGPRNPAGDAELNTFARERMFPEIDAAFEKTTGLNAFWYGSFEGEFGEAERGHTRWESYPAEPRFGTTYYGLRNRLSVLVESYTYAPYKQRVEATRAYVLETLRWTAAHSGEVIELARDADLRTNQKGELMDEPDDLVALRSRGAAWPRKATILGYEEETVDGRSRSTGKPAEYSVDLMDRFEPTLSVKRPLMYVIPADPALDPIVAKLEQHGVRVDTLGFDKTYEIEEYTITSATPASREFQGHVLVRCEVETTVGTREFPKGTRIVRTAQGLGTLAALMLEPQSEDSLATWNSFDAWMKPGSTYPVLRVMRKKGGP